MGINKKIREEVYDRCNKRCAYCGNFLEYDKMQVDHLVPNRLRKFKNKYPMDFDAIENLMPACQRCNHYKRALSLEAFRKRILTLHQRIVDLYIVKVAEDYGLITFKLFDGKFYFEKNEVKNE